MIFRRETRARKHRRILTILSGKDGKSGWWNRRLALLGGGAAAAAGIGYAALRQPGEKPVRYLNGDSTILYRGNGSEPLSLDPAYVQGEPEENVTGDLNVGLITLDPACKPIPGIAERWTASPDGLNWTFHLREARWSDGAPLTAEDFVFGWRRLLDAKTAAFYAYYLFVVKNAEKVNTGKLPVEALGVRAVDARTFEVTLEHPAPYLVEMLTHMTCYPQPRHVIAAKGKDWIKPGNHVSSGPFMLTEWTPRERITVVRNPHFYDVANVALEKVVYYPTDDYGVALQRLRAGELDTQTRIPVAQVDWIRANMPEIYHPRPQLTVEYVVPNYSRKPFDDVRIRQAISLSLSREAVSNKIRRVGDVPAYAVVPPGIANYPGTNKLWFHNLPQNARIERGRALMQEAGYGPGRRLKTTFMIRSTAAGSGRAAAAAVQQMLAQVYIDAAIVANDFATFMSVTSIHDFDICQAAWSADFNDAQTFLDLFVTGNGNNWGAYSNKVYDGLMTQSRSEIDLQRRAEILSRAEQLLLNDHATAPLFFWVTPSMARPYVKNWLGNPLDIHRARWARIDGAEKSRTRVL
jgi:oligopeptide transport system substrate-binding protein